MQNGFDLAFMNVFLLFSVPRSESVDDCFIVPKIEGRVTSEEVVDFGNQKNAKAHKVEAGMEMSKCLSRKDVSP